MAGERTFELRAQTEQDFVAAATAAVIWGTMDAADLAPLCPPDMLAEGSVWAAIYRGMCDMAAAGKKVSLPGLYEHLTLAVQAKLPGYVPVIPADLEAHSNSIFGNNDEAVAVLAGNVCREGMKRIAEGRLMALVADCQRYGNDPAEIAAGLSALAAGMEGGRLDETTLAGALDRMMAVLDKGEAAAPLPTPWPALNRVLKGGLVPGELAVLAARPGLGKTALAGCMAVETARAGVPVLFISREVKEYTLLSRIMAREARVDSRIFRQGIGNAQGVREKLLRCKAELSGLPLRIVEKSVAPMCPREVRRLAKSLKGVGLVIVDYLQLLCPDQKNASREREVAEMSRSMKQLALDCDCPVLLLSQLNRRVEEGDREPRLSDLRESGAIEQDADIVMFLHTTQANQKMPKAPVKAIVAKGRSSGTGVANLVFDKPFADFVEDQNAGVWAAKFERQESGL